MIVRKPRSRRAATDIVDHLTPERRSALMSKIRGKNTAPELRVRRTVHALGYRFRLHRRDLPGSPDLVFPGRRKIIMVHGCFWHRHPGCSKIAHPKSRISYWADKFARNIERDKMVQQALLQAGWEVLVIWECQTQPKDRLSLALKLAEFLGD
ncbi:very short patch repair endonuclease [Mesorhizobium sp. ESP7-2]|uniref:very short patch repair endonuclease n=1 Tax=Mesorhizobium sp. ESP7-2 TaxID=2876622 RepID=UPI0021E2FA56|nr:very short patch repair endonuclease [Mesorhizobium sp. ESP7-2]